MYVCMYVCLSVCMHACTRTCFCLQFRIWGSAFQVGALELYGLELHEQPQGYGLKV